MARLRLLISGSCLFALACTGPLPLDAVPLPFCSELPLHREPPQAALCASTPAVRSAVAQLDRVVRARWAHADPGRRWGELKVRARFDASGAAVPECVVSAEGSRETVDAALATFESTGLDASLIAAHPCIRELRFVFSFHHER